MNDGESELQKKHQSVSVCGQMHEKVSINSEEAGTD